MIEFVIGLILGGFITMCVLIMLKISKIFEEANTMTYVLFKQFGNYCVTNKENYEAQISNERQIMKIQNCDNKFDALLTLHNLGYKGNIIDKTEE